MDWDEIAPDLSTWTIPANRAKNGVAHIVPLSPQAQAIMRGAPRFARDADEPELIFPGQRGPFNGFGAAKTSARQGERRQRLATARLRRTMATGLQKLGVRLEVTEAVLGHVREAAPE